MMDLWAELDLATGAVLRAGTFLASQRGQDVQVLGSEGRNVKLKLDVESEDLILERLRAESPHPVLAEEGGQYGTVRSGSVWVVDPLDGSANFARNVPVCAVSVALMDGAAPKVGVVYDFLRDEIFSGVPGLGAWVGHRDEPRAAAITVSSLEEVSQAYLATGLPVERDFSAEALAQFAEDLRRFKKVRMFGSAALSLAYVACGRVDAYAEDDIMLWDVAAGLALVRAAGGFTSVQSSQRKRWAVRVRASCRPVIWGDEGGSEPRG